MDVAIPLTKESKMISLVTACTDFRVLSDNLLKSEIVKKYPFTVIKDVTSIPAAYNSHTSQSEITIYVQQNVFLPCIFEGELLESLKQVPDDWGVIGVAGVLFQDSRRQTKGYVMKRHKPWGAPEPVPVEVDTVDEMLLITRGDLIFDERFDRWLYGADICLQAKKQGRKCYVVKGFVDEDGQAEKGAEFAREKELFKEKWKDYLPVATIHSLIQ